MGLARVSSSPQKAREDNEEILYRKVAPSDRDFHQITPCSRDCEQEGQLGGMQKSPEQRVVGV